MRARNIKPDFFRDAELAEVTIEARYLFIGLWCLADRGGKLKDNPKQIRFEIFPETKLREEIDALLNQLYEHGLIIRYTVDGSNFIFVKNFLKHQSPHHTEKASKFPDPPELTVTHGELPLCSREIPLNPDLLNPELGILNKPPKPPKGGDGDFDIFWKTYPKKVGKGDALKKWGILHRSTRLPPLNDLLAAIEEQKTWDQWQKDGGQYIPNPATWLNQGRWEDEKPEEVKPQWMKELLAK